jgi:REP element-mobilizing transposase RayT
MARPLRIEYEGAVYHITARGNERSKIFFSKKDYEKFKEYLAEAQQKFGFFLHAYVLMTNHYHLIIETPDKNLSRVMHHINSSYTTYINVKRKRSGHLFQGRFKAILVDRDSYLLELSRYLHLNPVRANMTQKPEEYFYSSYRAYISGITENIVRTDTVLGLLTGNEKEAKELYRNFVEGVLGEEPESPLKKVYGGIILGSAGFIKDVLLKIEDGQLEKENVACRKELRAPTRGENVLSAICRHYQISKEDLIAGRSAVRKICIYLLKKETASTTREIGELLGNMSCTAVAKVYQRFTKEVELDDRLGLEVGVIRAQMSHVGV